MRPVPPRPSEPRFEAHGAARHSREARDHTAPKTEAEEEEEEDDGARARALRLFPRSPGAVGRERAAAVVGGWRVGGGDQEGRGLLVVLVGLSLRGSSNNQSMASHVSNRGRYMPVQAGTSWYRPVQCLI